jgi:uncharacterized protein (UPF0332 family)
MLENKEIIEAKANAIKSINNGEIIKTKDIQYVEFFIENSNNSLHSATALFKLSSDKQSRMSLGFENFNGHLWVINASYYSMFYMVRALLEKIGVKIVSDNSIHFNVFNALVYYFYSNGKLDRKFIEDFENAGMESAQILGKEKARKVIEDYSSEKEKRVQFTYKMGQNAMMNKAEISLNRARLFNEELRKLILI